MQFQIRVIACLCLGAAVPDIAGAGVIVVSPTSGGSIQAAVNSAADGDTILVQGTLPGGAEAVVIQAKGLTLIGDGPQISPNFGTHNLVVRNLAANQSVTVVNMSISLGFGNAVDLADNAGPVRLYHCNVRGGTGFAENPSTGQAAIPGHAAAIVVRCKDVAFIDCELTGGNGGKVSSPQQTASSPGGIGLLMIDSTVSLFDEFTYGGDGGTVNIGFTPLGSDGGAAVRNEGGRLYLHRTWLYGGDAGENDSGGHPAVSGGAGYQQVGSASHVAGRATGALGGNGVGLSPDGNPSEITGGTQQTYPGSLATFGLVQNSPIRPGDAMTIESQFLPAGTQLLLMASFAPNQAHLPLYQGTLLIDLPLAINPLLLGTGFAVTFIHHFPLGFAPLLPPGVDSINIYLQGVEVAANGTTLLGGTEMITLLNGGF